MRQVSLLLFVPLPSCFSDQQRNDNRHFRRIADSDFDAFVCSDELVCTAALFPPYARLVVADILFLLRHNLGVVVEVVDVLQHLSREPSPVAFLCCPPEENCRMISVLLILSSHVFRLEERNMTLRLAKLRSSTGILLNDVARDRTEIVVVLMKCCGTPRLLHISFTTAMNSSDFREGVAIGALKFRRSLTEFKDLCAVHVF